jgi:hypothetical protein
MEKSAKIFLLGCVLGTAMVGYGYIKEDREKENLTSLVARCESEKLVTPKGPWLKYQEAPLVCEPEALMKLTDWTPVGVQREIVESASKQGAALDSSIIAALGLVLLFALPYLWYFLLRRIRELSSAIRNDG